MLPSLLLALALQAPAHHQASRVSMACTYTIEAYGPDAAALPAILEAGLDEVDRIDRLMSHYKPESALSRINREGATGPVAVDPSCSASSRSRSATAASPTARSTSPWARS